MSGARGTPAYELKSAGEGQGCSPLAARSGMLLWAHCVSGPHGGEARHPHPVPYRAGTGSRGPSGGSESHCHFIISGPGKLLFVTASLKMK